MIKNQEPLSTVEAIELVKKSQTDSGELISFVKKFVLVDSKKAKKIRETLKELNLLKIKGEDISKIIDFMPENSLELNKIFVDVGLDEDETKKILEIIKSNK